MGNNPLNKIRDQHQALAYVSEVARTRNTDDFQVPLIDIYPNDTCNCRCQFCVSPFGRSNLPIEVVKLLAKLRPRVITITGGGEPSIYKDGKHRIEDFVAEIRTHLGTIPIGMMTNGTRLIDTNTVNELAWLRISINAASREAYQDIHGCDFFNRVVNNTATFINSGIPQVGIGFVYTPKTACQITKFAEMVLDRLKPKTTEDKFNRLTLQFRPVADRDYSRYHLSDVEKEALRSQSAKISDEAQTLLSKQSNFRQVLDNQCFGGSSPFQRCWISFLQMNIDANGDSYPCPQKTHKREDSYGNIFDPDFFDKIKAEAIKSFESHSCTNCPTCTQTTINNLYDSLDWPSISFDQAKPVFF
ncbi:radical SAM protein [Patescibacteria group bacterium]|nr:radical SAM protein [Patescibacteria group bacterium]